MRRGIVYIMRGPSGFGKTTEAKRIIAKNGGVGMIHSTDNYFYDEHGNFQFDPRLLSKYHAWNLTAFMHSLEQGVPIVICDNTNLEKRDYFPYLEAASKFGYSVRIVRMPYIDPIIAAGRNVHGVDALTISNMMNRFED